MEHAEDTSGRADRAPTIGNDVAAQQNEQAVYVPNENYRNALREAKHQQDLLKDYFIHVGALVGQEDRISVTTDNPGGRIWHLLVFFKINPLFPELLFKLVLLKIPTNFQSKSNLFPTSSKTISSQITSPAKYFQVQNLTNFLGESKMVSKGSKVTKLNP